MNKIVDKILFVQKVEDGLFETEGLWCIKVAEGNYIVDNIPFIAKRISLGDTIKVLFDEEDKVFYFEDFVAVSGNTTVRVYVYDKDDLAEVRKAVESFSCESEVFLARELIAINVPKEVDYFPLKRYLEQGEQNGKWSYEESCLAHEY